MVQEKLDILGKAGLSGDDFAGCDAAHQKVSLGGLIFTRMPFASCDSPNRG